MRHYVIAVMFCFWGMQTGQNPKPTGLTDGTSHSVSSSRLVALAELGSRTRTSILVESGDFSFLQQPVSHLQDRPRFADSVADILAGPERYAVRERGRLMIVYPLKPAKRLNRILRMSFGPVTYRGHGISDLDPLVSFLILKARGCKPQGYGWAGPPLDLKIPAFSSPSMTFEAVVEQVANAEEPTMWVVRPETGVPGCISSPQDQWQVGFYSYSSAQGHRVFRQSAGAELVK